MSGEVEVRRARTDDVPAVRALVDRYAPDRRLLSKATVTLYEDVQEFVVAQVDGQVVGCAALHVLWADLAEVRTVAVDPEVQGRGVGSALLQRLLRRAADLGVRRVFCLTFETAFFARHGFAPADEVLVDARVQEELLRSHDEGVAEFLDLAHVRPNTLGNTRMLKVL
ncbi:MAG: GCN5-related N-acetyltransferase [Frankiales bacterium]|nr:GCN5-related N-acetyltransferase [Frankiales bacterium]